MADLRIRNLTAQPLELKLVERFEGQIVPGNSDPIGNVTSKITGIFNKTSTATAPNVQAQGEPHDRRDVSFPFGPFESRSTDVRAPDPGREVVRLTFESEGQRYQVDVPSSSQKSTVMTRLDGAPKEYTVIYVVNGGTLAIFSSTNLGTWMRELRNEHALSALSIPGTHNSPTCHVALPSVRCQAVNVREQLNNGVRFLDIRVSCSPDSQDLILVHSAFPISLTGNKYLRDLVNELYGFLDANNSETILVSLKREGTGKGTDQQLSKILREHYCGDGNRWFTEPRVPTLGEVRGKVILVRRFVNDESLNGEHDGRGWGVDGSVWPDNCEDGTCGSGHIRVQDFYEVGESTNIQKKIELARAQLERAGVPVFNLEQPPLPLFVNFLSASNFFKASCWPEKIAAQVNPAMIEYLSVRHGEHAKGPAGLGVGDAATGIVVTDWVGENGDWDLIRCIVGWNARLQLKQ